jgi:hypothetical protein
MHEFVRALLPLVPTGVGASILATLALAIPFGQRILAWIWANRKQASAIIAATILLGFCAAFWFRFGPDRVTVWLDPLDTELQAGNWKVMVCVLNAVAHCAPERRPILIIRELTNLEPATLTNLLTALEPMKQGDIHFPVFLETSDFQWVQNERVIKSDKSFASYYLPEMSKEEGRAELVVKYKIWSAEEFEQVREPSRTQHNTTQHNTQPTHTTPHHQPQVYDAVGGHMGSLRALFDNQVSGASLSEALKGMDDDADRQMDAAMEAHPDLKAAKKWLNDFKDKDYFIEVKGTPAVLEPLLAANILFKKGYEITPQHRSMRHAIGRYVAKFAHGR